MIIVMIKPPIRRLPVTTAPEVTPASLRLPRQEDAEAGVLQGTSMVLHCYHFFSLYREVVLIM
jgi:hypothetical protein